MPPGAPPAPAPIASRWPAIAETGPYAGLHTAIGEAVGAAVRGAVAAARGADWVLWRDGESGHGGAVRADVRVSRFGRRDHALQFVPRSVACASGLDR